MFHMWCIQTYPSKLRHESSRRHVTGRGEMSAWGSPLEWLFQLLISLTFLFSSAPTSSPWILIKVKPSFISIARQQVCCQMTFPELNMTWQPRLYNNLLYERQSDKARNYWDRVCSPRVCCCAVLPLLLTRRHSCFLLVIFVQIYIIHVFFFFTLECQLKTRLEVLTEERRRYAAWNNF